MKIRVTLEEFEQLEQLIERMRTINQLDAVYIFNKMKMESVFTYVAFRKPLGPELKFIKDQEAFFDDTFISRTCDRFFNKFGELLSSPLINELEKVNDEYEDVLKQSSGRLFHLVKTLLRHVLKSSYVGTLSDNSPYEHRSMYFPIFVKHPVECSSYRIFL